MRYVDRTSLIRQSQNAVLVFYLMIGHFYACLKKLKNTTPCLIRRYRQFIGISVSFYFRCFSLSSERKSLCAFRCASYWCPGKNVFIKSSIIESRFACFPLTMSCQQSNSISRLVSSFSIYLCFCARVVELRRALATLTRGHATNIDTTNVCVVGKHVPLCDYYMRLRW